MDSQMVYTHKFVQSNPHWHPLISQLYFSLALYIHIIRCMIEADPTHTELVQFYDNLYRHAGLESFMIPGPLVPIFAAITYSSSPFEWIGNICPMIPLVTGASARNGFRLTNRVYMALPSIPFIIDQIHSLTGLLSNEEHYSSSWNSVEFIFNRPVDQNSLNFNMLTPNARFNVFVPFRQAATFDSVKAGLRLPTRLTANAINGSTAIMSYDQFFGFTNYTTGTHNNWTTTVTPPMSTYSTFFQGSTSLMSISATGLGASLPRAIYTANSNVVPVAFAVTPAVAAAAAANGNPAVTAAAAYFPRAELSSTAAHYHHNAPNLSELAEQYAIIAQVNCDFTESDAVSAVVNGPTNATLRNGSFWSIPNMRSSPNTDVFPGIANNIAAYYHSAVPVRK